MRFINYSYLRFNDNNRRLNLTLKVRFHYFTIKFHFRAPWKSPWKCISAK